MAFILRLAHSIEDTCNCCVRIDIQLKRNDFPANKHNCVLMEKEMHLDAAIGQHCMVSNFMKEFVKHHAPNQLVPPTIVPYHYDDEHYDDDGGDSHMTFSTIAPQI